MFQPIRIPTSFSRAALPIALVLATAGCLGTRQPDELARAVAVGERPVAMQGTGSFFGGGILATVTISRGIGKGTGDAHNGGEKAKILSIDGMDKDEARAYVNAKNQIGSPLPPVTLHIKVLNTQKSAVSVEIEDFDSDLGNFAVEPAIVVATPGQTVEPNPMVSQLGVTSDEIPVKVSLRLAGKRETQTILVRSLVVAPPAAQK
jgi:hypothetical protein